MFNAHRKGAGKHKAPAIHVSRSGELADGSTMKLVRGWHVFGQESDIQKPFDVAVIMPTVGRLTLVDAVRSVFCQQGELRIQVLIGVDAPLGFFDELILLLKAAPLNVSVCL